MARPPSTPSSIASRSSISPACRAGRFRALRYFHSLTHCNRSLASWRRKGIAAGAPYAVLQPAARLPEMRWPVAEFAELARWLREKHGMASVVNLGSARP